MSKPSASGYAPVNGVEVYFEIHGEGKPLIVLHGGFGGIELFGPVLPNGELVVQGRQIIGVELQGHGRTLPFDRPMTFANMANDVAELVRFLGLDAVDVLGYSLGGITALRMAINHPDVVNKLVLVSTPFAFSGLHDYNAQGIASITPEAMMQTPLYEFYRQVAPDVNNWSKFVTQTRALLEAGFDWSAEVGSIKSPTLIVAGDWDSIRASHAVQFFELLGGGKQDARWDRSGIDTQNRLAILPNVTHYDIFESPLLPRVVSAFIE